MTHALSPILMECRRREEQAMGRLYRVPIASDFHGRVRASPIWLADRTNPALLPARNGFRALSPCTRPALAIFLKRAFALWSREPDSNRRPPAYETGEQPLLYPAIFSCSRLRHTGMFRLDSRSQK